MCKGPEVGGGRALLRPGWLRPSGWKGWVSSVAGEGAEPAGSGGPCWEPVKGCREGAVRVGVHSGKSTEGAEWKRVGTVVAGVREVAVGMQERGRS